MHQGEACLLQDVSFVHFSLESKYLSELRTNEFSHTLHNIQIKIRF